MNKGMELNSATRSFLKKKTKQMNKFHDEICIVLPPTKFQNQPNEKSAEKNKDF